MTTVGRDLSRQFPTLLVGISPDLQYLANGGRVHELSQVAWPK
jgi:hypothetical protein